MKKPELVQRLREMANRIQSFSWTEPEAIQMVEDLLSEMKTDYKKETV